MGDPSITRPAATAAATVAEPTQPKGGGAAAGAHLVVGMDEIPSAAQRNNVVVVEPPTNIPTAATLPTQQSSFDFASVAEAALPLYVRCRPEAVDKSSATARTDCLALLRPHIRIAAAHAQQARQLRHTLSRQEARAMHLDAWFAEEHLLHECALLRSAIEALAHRNYESTRIMAPEMSVHGGDRHAAFAALFDDEKVERVSDDANGDLGGHSSSRRRLGSAPPLDPNDAPPSVGRSGAESSGGLSSSNRRLCGVPNEGTSVNVRPGASQQRLAVEHTEVARYVDLLLRIVQDDLCLWATEASGGIVAGGGRPTAAAAAGPVSMSRAGGPIQGEGRQQVEDTLNRVARTLLSWSWFTREGSESDDMIIAHHRRLALRVARVAINGLFPVPDTAEVASWSYRRTRLTSLEEHISSANPAALETMQFAGHLAFATLIVYFPYVFATMPTKAFALALEDFFCVPVSFVQWAASPVVQKQAVHVLTVAKSMAVIPNSEEELSDCVCDYVLRLAHTDPSAFASSAPNVLRGLLCLLRRRVVLKRRVDQQHQRRMFVEQKLDLSRAVASRASTLALAPTVSVSSLTERVTKKAPATTRQEAQLRRFDGVLEHIVQKSRETLLAVSPLTEELFERFEFPLGFKLLDLLDMVIYRCVQEGNYPPLISIFEGGLDVVAEKHWKLLLVTAKSLGHLDRAFSLCVAVLQQNVALLRVYLKAAFPFFDDVTVAQDPELADVSRKLRRISGD